MYGIIIDVTDDMSDSVYLDMLNAQCYGYAYVGDIDTSDLMARRHQIDNMIDELIAERDRLIDITTRRLTV